LTEPKNVEDSVAGRIRRAYAHMPAAQRSFADFVLKHPVDAARMSIHAAVREVKVSVATANRFARSVGFSGYAEFRDELIRSFDTVFEPVRRLERNVSGSSSAAEIMRGSIADDLDNLSRTVTGLSEQDCRKALHLILNARNICVLGFDSAAHLGALLAWELDRVRGNVRSVENLGGGMGAARHLFRFDRSDLAIAIAFPRYIKDTVELARFAVSRGVPLLALTDGHRSPLASIADVSLFAVSERRFASTSNAAVLALIEALAAAVAQKSKNSVKAANEFAAFAFPWMETDQIGSGVLKTPRKRQTDTRSR
jgi:DNA-binding MurR/RpiR family transcriptional regulator